MLVVYNTCGISGSEKVDYYITAIQALLEQNFPYFRIVISSCLNNEHTRNTLQATFGNRCSYNWIDEKLPVNLTFNHSCQQATNYFDNFDSYLYIDSGMLFDRPDAFRIMHDLLRSGPYGIVSALANNDNATEYAFGWYRPSEDFVIPVGQAINGHVMLFDRSIYTTYKNRCMPDIFASFCSESVLSFLCAAIKKKWVISSKLYLPHLKGCDGASSGFYPHGLIPHWHLFKSARPMQEICLDEEGKRLGFGYEECNKICMHDPNAFDEEGYAKYPELVDFLKDNIFIQDELFDYNNVNHRFIP